ncbi:ABC transporter substrate-binding protein [Rhodobacteraceae bacterium D3-12]|nr:ABC transporter substrate-binding protein [Rhodobacteraceae bacterium D3-12]
MSVLARLSNKTRNALLAWALLCAPAFADAPGPSRVVSINLCTDQLAMLLAAPEQLHSVSFIALDGRVSAMTKEAGSYVINHGRAEEIYLLRPDLVVAGAFTPRSTVEMLRRLNIPVTVFAPANTLDDVRARVTQMGEVLHRTEAAQAMLDDFDARLEQITTDIAERPRAILYYANGYTSGDNTLAGQILLAAGFRNAASETGWTAGRKLPLEVLAMTDPDIVITARPYPGASRSEAVLDHPVVQALRANSASTALADQNWVCGTPFVLRAIENLAAARLNLTEAAQ